MRWTYLVLVFAALLALTRIVSIVRRNRGQAHDDWDARLVQNLRSAGGNAFTPYAVDFFFNLPDEATCTVLRGVLEPEGFSIDARVATGEGASGYSLHAQKAVRISVATMQEFSQRFRALAKEHGGHYDGWMTDPGPR
jgi:hypothetical protein